MTDDLLSLFDLFDNAFPMSLAPRLQLIKLVNHNVNHLVKLVQHALSGTGVGYIGMIRTPNKHT